MKEEKYTYKDITDNARLMVRHWLEKSKETDTTLSEYANQHTKTLYMGMAKGAYESWRNLTWNNRHSKQTWEDEKRIEELFEQVQP